MSHTFAVIKCCISTLRVVAVGLAHDMTSQEGLKGLNLVIVITLVAFMIVALSHITLGPVGREVVLMVQKAHLVPDLHVSPPLQQNRHHVRITLATGLHQGRRATLIRGPGYARNEKKKKQRVGWRVEGSHWWFCDSVGGRASHTRVRGVDVGPVLQ